jgi:hypothetical protein
MLIPLFITANIALANPKPSGSLGVGVAIGAPSGFAGKLYIGESFGAQFSFGGDLGRIGDVGLTTDFVVHLSPLNDPSDGYSLPFYLGGGFSASTNHSELNGDTYFGPRAVMGVMIIVDGVPVDIYIETAPTLYIMGPPKSPISWGVDGQLGFRYYF